MDLHSGEQNGSQNLGKENLSWLHSQIATQNYLPALSLKDNLHTEVGDPRDCQTSETLQFLSGQPKPVFALSGLFI